MHAVLCGNLGGDVKREATCGHMNNAHDTLRAAHTMLIRG